MIAIAKKLRPSRNPDWHRQFLQMLPLIERHASCAFRKMPAEQREDAVREVVASSFCAFHRLVQLGKQDLAYAGVLARFAIAHYRSGRRVGNKINSRDVLGPAGARRRRTCVVSLAARCGHHEWSEILSDDTQTPVADQAAFRIDYPDWLARLNRRDRRLAEFLVMGNTTGEAAQRFGLSEGRISQIRKKLCNSWTNFHGAIEPWEAVRFARTRRRLH